MKQKKVLIGIGERIKYLRGDESLPTFAEKLGVHKNTLARYEKEKGLPDVAFVLKLCNIVNDEDVTPSWLIEGDGPNPAPPYSEAHEELRDRIKPLGDLMIATEQVKGRGLSISPQNIVGYVNGSYLPTDKELHEICYAYNYFDEWVTSHRKPQQVSGVLFTKGSSENRIYKADVMLRVLVVTEECLSDVKFSLSPEKKAELITIIYEEVYDTNLEGKPLLERVFRLLKLTT